MMANFALQARYTYKGMFLWLNWPGYVSNVFLQPVLFLVMLVFAGRFVNDPELERLVVTGMAAYAIPHILIGGTTQCFFYERVFGTLPFLFSSSVSRLTNYWSRGVLHYPNGIIATSTSLLFGWILLDLNLTRIEWSSLIISILLITATCTSFALFLGNLSLHFNQGFLPAAIGTGIIVTMTGVIMPTSRLPFILEELSYILPLTSGLEAFRDSISGVSLGSVRHHLFIELLVGLGYGVAGSAGFMLLEANAKRNGAYETFRL